jgi:hypothetical protein
LSAFHQADIAWPPEETLSCDRSWNAFAKSEGQRRRASYQGLRQPQPHRSKRQLPGPSQHQRFAHRPG